MSWANEPLGALCEIQNGFAFQSRDYVEEGARVIRIGNVQKGEIVDKGPKFIPMEQLDEYGRFQIAEGDILISLTGDVGRVGRFPASMLPALLNQRVGRVTEIKEKDISIDFLFYVLNSDWFESLVIDSAEGAAQKNSSTKKIKSIEIPLPPLPEQQRIVGKLDAAFAALGEAQALVERNRANARELFESYLNGVFERKGDGWENLPLEDLARFIDYRGRTPDKTSSGLRLITAKNVKMGHLQRQPEEFVAPESYAEWMTRGIPEYGDVLFTTEAPLANVAQLDTRERVVFAQRIIILQPKKQLIDQTFLKYALLSGSMQKDILAKGTGATVSGIKASLLKKIKVSFPSIPEQQRLVAALDEMTDRSKHLETTYQQKLSELAVLKKGLLGAAFRGEL